MREIFPYPQEQREFQERKKEEQASPEKDPYDFMNPRDRWMIGKPADKACLDYVESFIRKREKNHKHGTGLIAAFYFPPPLNFFFYV